VLPQSTGRSSRWAVSEALPALEHEGLNSVLARRNDVASATAVWHQVKEEVMEIHSKLERRTQLDKQVRLQKASLLASSIQGYNFISTLSHFV